MVTLGPKWQGSQPGRYPLASLSVVHTEFAKGATDDRRIEHMYEERETGLEPATSTLGRSRSAR